MGTGGAEGRGLTEGGRRGERAGGTTTTTEPDIRTNSAYAEHARPRLPMRLPFQMDGAVGQTLSLELGISGGSTI